MENEAVHCTKLERFEIKLKLTFEMTNEFGYESDFFTAVFGLSTFMYTSERLILFKF